MVSQCYTTVKTVIETRNTVGESGKMATLHDGLEPKPSCNVEYYTTIWPKLSCNVYNQRKKKNLKQNYTTVLTGNSRVMSLLHNGSYREPSCTVLHYTTVRESSCIV